MDSIAPSDVRYIKLGQGNTWFERCRELGRIEFGHPDIPHELATSGDWEAVNETFLKWGRSTRKASDFTREIRDFYTLPDDCLWVTFADGHLWWTFAGSDVLVAGEGDEATRYRDTLIPWQCVDIDGEPLVQSTMSTRLTQVAAYRQTLCSVSAERYLVRRINAEVEPGVTRVIAAREELVAATADLITMLHWRDFEVLVDLIFVRTGWQRVSEVGGSQKDTDLIVEQPLTGERAFVQVKSKADRAVFEESVSAYRRDGSFSRMYFVCHSAKGGAPECEASDVSYLSGDVLAGLVTRLGLHDWVVARSA